jgi:predicted HTH domain antitoxin
MDKENKRNILEAMGIGDNIEKEKVTPKEKEITSESIQRKRNELEEKRIEIEIAKLDKPDTSVDYFNQMLAIQKDNFSQLLAMEKQHSNLQLEIEKLKLLGSDSEDNTIDILKTLLPYLPKLLPTSPKQNANSSEGIKGEGTVAQINSPPLVQNKVQEVEKMDTPKNLEELDRYMTEIKEGKISLTKAYKDFLSTPYGKTLTKEQFRIKFEEIKNSKI